MRLFLQIMLAFTIAITLMAGYAALVAYTGFIEDSVLEKWAYFHPENTFLKGLLSIIILWEALKYEPTVFRIVKPRKTVKVAVYVSLFFVIVATIAWSDAWSGHSVNMPDSREVGDSIWKLGHPLTFLIIDLPIYLRIKHPNLQHFWSDIWALPMVLLLFLLQSSVYVHGVRMLISFKRIKNAVKAK